MMMMAFSAVNALTMFFSIRQDYDQPKGEKVLYVFIFKTY